MPVFHIGEVAFFAVSATHIAGQSNNAADALSRNDLPRFFFVLPHANSSFLNSSLPAGLGSRQGCIMDIQPLVDMIQTLYGRGLAQSST